MASTQRRFDVVTTFSGCQQRCYLTLKRRRVLTGCVFNIFNFFKVTAKKKYLRCISRIDFINSVRFPDVSKYINKTSPRNN